MFEMIFTLLLAAAALVALTVIARSLALGFARAVRLVPDLALLLGCAGYVPRWKQD